jgi:hypothetical protein
MSKRVHPDPLPDGNEAARPSTASPSPLRCARCLSCAGCRERRGAKTFQGVIRVFPAISQAAL